MFFESFFEKVFRRVVMFDIPLCSHRFCRVARVLYVWGRVGFLLGLRPRGFVFTGPSFACEGLCVRVGVIAWVWCCWGVRGAVGGVGHVTVVWVCVRAWGVYNEGCPVQG